MTKLPPSPVGTRVGEQAWRGVAYGASAYLLWGLFPLYWPLLEPAGPVELLAHRVAWSALTMVALVTLLGLGPRFVAILRDTATRNLLTVAAVVITVNWGVYIHGVTSEQVVETSLGYFINPLVTVAAGVVVLGERLRRSQWAAIAVAAAGVLVLTVEAGRPPWIALALAFSFASYGLIKKQADAPAVEGLAVETLALAPLAVGYLTWLSLNGGAEATSGGLGRLALLSTTGLVTAIPLICFGAAATRVPLTTLGILQYLGPTVQFALGVLVLGEQLGEVKLIGFIFIWVALVMFTLDSARQRRLLKLKVQASAM